MEAKLARTRHFFKVMMPGFRDKLNLPPGFCEKLKQEKSKWAFVKSCKGTWKINFCRNSEGLICFKDGWSKFVHSHGLSIGDFVLFEHIGDLNFNASVFDPTACEKEFLFKIKEEQNYESEEVFANCQPKTTKRKSTKEEHDDESEEVNINSQPKSTKRKSSKESGIQYNSKNPHFIVTMTPYLAQKCGRVTIPVNLSRSNNIGNKSSVILRDPRGRAWSVKLTVHYDPVFRSRMYTGWHDFYVSNKLKDGDICVFDINPDSLQSTSKTLVMDVQIFPAPI